MRKGPQAAEHQGDGAEETKSVPAQPSWLPHSAWCPGPPGSHAACPAQVLGSSVPVTVIPDSRATRPAPNLPQRPEAAGSSQDDTSSLSAQRLTAAAPTATAACSRRATSLGARSGTVMQTGRRRSWGGRSGGRLSLRSAAVPSRDKLRRSRSRPADPVHGP